MCNVFGVYTFYILIIDKEITVYRFPGTQTVAYQLYKAHYKQKLKPMTLQSFLTSEYKTSPDASILITSFGKNKMDIFDC